MYQRTVTSWQLWIDFVYSDARPLRVTGVPDGPLLLWPGPCSVLQVETPGSSPSCIDVPGDADGPVEIADAWMAGADRWWLLATPRGGYSYVQLWSASTLQYAAYWEMGESVGLWGDRVGAFAASPSGVFAGGSGGSGRRLDTPPGPYVGLWGVNRDEIGVATRDGRLALLDAFGWTTYRTAMVDLLYVRGAASAVALASARAIGSGPPSDVALLRSWSDPHWVVAGLAHFASDVFAVLRQVDAALECDRYWVVRFGADGSAYRL